MEELNVSLI